MSELKRRRLETRRKKLERKLSRVTEGTSLEAFKMQDLREIAEVPGFENNRDEYVYRIKKALELGNKRNFVQASEQQLERLEKLYEKFPHCAELIRYVQTQVAISIFHDRKLLHMRPAAITGKPGQGKTAVLVAISEALGVPKIIINCAAKNTGMYISGLDKGYSGSHPGLITEYLVLMKKAVLNPLVILDEFEKPAENPSNGENFHASFYELLEELTAKVFLDRFFNFPVDASMVNFLFTVNDFSALPEPIQTRIKCIEINPPSDDGLKKIIPSIYKSLLERRSVGNAFSERLSGEVVNELLTLKNPRAIYKTLDSAMSESALLKNAHTRSFKLKVSKEHVVRCKPVIAEKRSIGFH